jgi:hypothetical protein
MNLFKHFNTTKGKFNALFFLFYFNISWVPGALSLGAKRPGREADHSPPSSAGGGQRMRGAIPPLPNTPSWRGAQLSTGTTLPLPLSVGIIGLRPVLSGTRFPLF